MWNKAEDVPKDAADQILERWDQTEPRLQRMIVLQRFLDVENQKTLNTQLRDALGDLLGQIKEHDRMDGDVNDFDCVWGFDTTKAQQVYDAAKEQK